MCDTVAVCNTSTCALRVADSRARVGGARVRVQPRLISRANLRACIQWVSAVNASNHPPAMATRGYHYRRAGRYSFHLQL